MDLTDAQLQSLADQIAERIQPRLVLTTLMTVYQFLA